MRYLQYPPEQQQYKNLISFSQKVVPNLSNGLIDWRILNRSSYLARIHLAGQSYRKNLGEIAHKIHSQIPKLHWSVPGTPDITALSSIFMA